MTRLLARPDFWIGLAASAGLMAASVLGWIASPPLEALAFVTGAVCVYLVVRQNVWNFPFGILNAVALFALFASGKLYGEAGLQVMFLLLNVHGWYAWVRGGPGHTELKVSRVPPGEAAVIAAAVPAVALGLRWGLERLGGSAPLEDAQITALSLGAQWMLNRKYIENWFVWIALDVLSVHLYFRRELYLVAGLYVLFLGMCVAGVVTWTRTLRGMTRAEMTNDPPMTHQ